MYNKRTKIFFGFMAFLMFIGYPLSLLAGFPAFTNLFTSGNTSTDPAKIVSSTLDDIHSHPNDKGRLKTDLQKLGSAYGTLAAPDAQGNTPPDADRNLQKSIDAFQQLVKLEPHNTDAKRYLANAYGANQSWTKAMQIYQTLAKSKSDPNHTDYLYALGYSAEQANKTDTALAAYKQFVKLVPDDPNAESAREAIKSLKTGTSGATTVPTS